MRVSTMRYSAALALRSPPRLSRYRYAHILRHIVPLFRDRAWGDEEIATLLERNPARLLTITGLKGE